MIFRNIKMNFNKILTSYGFYICVIFTIILCFCADIYEDFMTGDKYSVISSLLNFNRDFMLKDTSFSSLEIMLRSSKNWLSLFIPIISAFAFVPLVCDEYEAKSVRFEVFRSSKTVYHTSKFISACLCGGLAIMIGFGIFLIIEFLIFPNIYEYEAGLQTMYLENLSFFYPNIKESGFTIIYIEKLSNMFFYGVVSVAPVIMFTSVIRNKYLVMCIPFFLKYALNQTCIRMQTKALSDLQNTDENLYRFSTIINPDALSYLSNYGKDKNIVLIYNGIILLATFAIYIIISARRIDSGE